MGMLHQRHSAVPYQTALPLARRRRARATQPARSFSCIRILLCTIFWLQCYCRVTSLRIRGEISTCLKRGGGAAPGVWTSCASRVGGTCGALLPAPMQRRNLWRLLVTALGQARELSENSVLHFANPYTRTVCTLKHGIEPCMIRA